MNSIKKLEVDIYNEAIRHHVQSISHCTKIIVSIAAQEKNPGDDRGGRLGE